MKKMLFFLLWLLTSAQVNVPPVVDAGPNQTATFPQALLNGSVSDDGPVSIQWVVESTSYEGSGPGIVVFGDTAKAQTTATFSAPGFYILGLRAHDGALTGSSDVAITVNPPQSGIPDAPSNLGVSEK